MLQLEDLFGTNVHYVGSRATGTAAGTYLLAGPRWDGVLPDGCEALLQFDTDLVLVIGRTQLLGPGDVEALGKVMDGYLLRSLSAFVGAETPQSPAFDWPTWNEEASRDERFIGFVNALLPLCQPTHPDEVELMVRFARIGIAPGEPFDPEAVDPDARTALRAGVERARTAMAKRAENLGEEVNGWAGVEAFGNRAWSAGDYRLRAASAMLGWGRQRQARSLLPGHAR